MKFIIGIDPGLSGAIAILDAQFGKIIQLEDMPVVIDKGKKKVSGAGLKKIFSQYPATDVLMIYLERVSARPGQGVVSMFNFGRSFGAVEAVVNFSGFPLTYVTPQSWKRSCSLIKASKDASRGRVLDLYPHADVQRKKDSGRADAILIARYGMETV